MAKLVDVWRDDYPVDMTRRQMPLIVDENLTVSNFFFVIFLRAQFLIIKS